MRISSLAELDNLRRAVEPTFEIRQDRDIHHLNSIKEINIRVCRGSGCNGSGGKKVNDTFIELLKEKGLGDHVRMIPTGCHGLCEMGPIVIINPGDILYTRIQVEDVPEIIEHHIQNGKIIERLLYHDPNTHEAISTYGDITFYLHQERRVLHNNGFINPWSIEEYIGRGGYQGLAKALTQMTPDEVLEEVGKSGIRGRGGAGFPTARKWQFVRSAVSDEKYVVCNGDEGDPGAYMNRSVLEGNPHSIIEGMTIGAYAIGNVKHGYAYIRAEYPLAIETIKHAIEEAKRFGFLGKNIFGTDFEFVLDVFPGAGAFVCGEETALLASLEGRRGNPRQRPPFPANVGGGLYSKPTTINNVETWSTIPQIIEKGADWYISAGTETSRGTKTFSLVGKINNTGLVEVPLGTPIGDIIFDIGEGIPGGKQFKAVQIGGPSGGVIPVSHLNTPVDYESVTALGAIMGSGGLVVMDEDNCMVDIAKYFLQFTQDESCGKCTPCRAGIPEMRQILTQVSNGTATLDNLAVLEELAEMISSSSLCGLGQTSPNPVLSTLRHFREEYEAHIIDKKCPAAVCTTLFKSPCQHTCPVGLDVPGYSALIKEGRYNEAYSLIKQRNPLPLVCGRVCTHPCESKCNRGKQDNPIAIRELKRFATDYAFNSGFTYNPVMKPKRTERIAIVGAGPAGLSAAWDLACEGFDVTIYEASPVAGGMLALTIPEYRLPKKLLAQEIAQIEELGVNIKVNSPVDDIDALLNDGYNAVFLAIGAHVGIKGNYPGEDLLGVTDSIHYLSKVNLGLPVTTGKKVAIIGGGNSAIDSARIAMRKGAEEVHVLYRRTRRDMGAQIEEITAAEEEGIIIHTQTNPHRILGQNKVEKIECVRTELKEFDEGGRRKPYPIKGTEFSIEVDMVIEALGQYTGTEFLGKNKVERGYGGAIVVDKRTLATNREGVFAGGDTVTLPQTVIEAIAAGQRAASSIRRYLNGEEPQPLVERIGDKPVQYSMAMPTDEELKPKNRKPNPEAPVERRKRSFEEAVLTFSEEQAREEAARCLRCDLEVEE